jgi:hypothetical protein
MVKKRRERGRGANRREKQAAPESTLIHPDHDIGRHMTYRLVHARPLGANHGLHPLQAETTTAVFRHSTGNLRSRKPVPSPHPPRFPFLPSISELQAFACFPSSL